MSVHRSLSAAGKGRGHRNVLSREERLAKLEEDGRWKDGMSVFGLQKVRSIKPVTGKKSAKKEAKAPAAAEGVPAEGAPAEGAPAAGAPTGGAQATGAEKAKK